MKDKKDSSAAAKKYENFPPEVVVTRLAKDVQLLLAIAKKKGFGPNWSRILNRTARLFLTPQFATKRIRNLQDQLGVSGIA